MEATRVAPAPHAILNTTEDPMNFPGRAFSRTSPSFRAAEALLALLFVLSPLVPAQNVRAPKVVKDIDVEFIGPQSVGEDRILSNMGLKVGDPFTQASLDRDIEALYASGLVDNIRILSEEMAGNGVRVIVVVQSRSGLAGVSFEGNTVFTDAKLSSKVELEVGGPVDEAQIQAGQREIRKLYRQSGFTEATVRYDIVSSGDNGLSRVIYTINEGGKTLLRNVEFVGNSAFSSKELREQMKSRPVSLFSRITKSGKLNPDQVEDDIASIERFYRNNGYLNASVVDVRRVRVDDSKVDLVLTIDEGELYTVSGVRLRGVEVFNEADVATFLKTQAGQEFSAASIESDITAIQSYYGSRGYAELNVTPRLDSTGGTSVQVTYEISEGSKYFVRQINIEGNAKTKDKVIRNELAIVPGDPLSGPRLRASKRRLENTGYFGSVDVMPVDTNDPEYKDINIRVSEKPTGSLNFGAGFSSIDNFVGFVEVTQTNFDIGNWPNFTGGGQRFRAAARVGTERRDFIVSFTEPWFMDKRLALGTELYYRDMFFLSNFYDQTNYGGSVSLRKGVGEHSHVSVDYSLENIEIGGITEDASPAIRAEAGDYTKSAIGLNYINDTRDDLFLTRTGRKLEFGVAYSGLGGDVENTHLQAGGVQYFNLPYDTIVSFSGDVHAVSGDDVPIFDRVFLGGANNLRGFDFRDVGPRDINGEAIGGLTSGFASAEVTVPIIQKVRGALFYDVGVVSADEFSFDGDVNSDWGVGLRLFLPVGPIRLDYAFPISTDEFNDSSGRFNFNIGYRF